MKTVLHYIGFTLMISAFACIAVPFLILLFIYVPQPLALIIAWTTLALIFYLEELVHNEKEHYIHRYRYED